ncbi:MAG: tRNA1(Val) (adenine(37)-N6)-methyltransferase [Acholeplasmataceae bacterium]
MIRTLLGTNLSVFQDRNQSFNLDSLLLASFALIPAKAKTVIDLGTGTGSVMLSLSERTQARIIGVEIQERLARRAQRNIDLNGLGHRLSVIHGDLKDLTIDKACCIVTNPPYFPVTDEARVNESDERAIARHELKLTLKELANSAARLLKTGGYLYLIHRPDRLFEIARELREVRLEVKRLRFVHPYADRRPNHVLIRAVKDGEMGLTVEPPLILYRVQNVYSDELKAIYRREGHATQSARP